MKRVFRAMVVADTVHLDRAMGKAFMRVANEAGPEYIEGTPDNVGPMFVTIEFLVPDPDHTDPDWFAQFE